MRKTLLILSFGLLFLGCTSKNKTEKNLTANAIHSKIYKAINTNYLDEADNLFLTLEAEHPGSIYIKTDLMSLYLAHLKYEDYELAKFYLDQYEKRFASLEEIPWCEYQKIKIDFLSYQNAYTNQGKVLKIINKCKEYKIKYPNSRYLYEVNTIYLKALLTNKYLDDKIYKLYKNEGKKAALEYKTNIPKNSKPPKVPWYKKIFYW